MACSSHLFLFFLTLGALFMAYRYPCRTACSLSLVTWLFEQIDTNLSMFSCPTCEITWFFLANSRLAPTAPSHCANREQELCERLLWRKEQHSDMNRVIVVEETIPWAPGLWIIQYVWYTICIIYQKQFLWEINLYLTEYVTLILYSWYYCNINQINTRCIWI